MTQVLILIYLFSMIRLGHKQRNLQTVQICTSSARTQFTDPYFLKSCLKSRNSFEAGIKYYPVDKSIS